MSGGPRAIAPRSGIMSEGALYRVSTCLASSLLELLSRRWVISPEGGPGMTRLGHAGAQDRVVALLLKVPRIRSAMEVGAGA